MPAVDHAALLTELIPLVDERYQAALRAGIADIGRLDKVERMKLDVDWSTSGRWTAWGLTSRSAVAASARAAIDGVRE